MKYDYTRKRPAAHVPRNAHSRSHKACNRLKKRRLLPPPTKHNRVPQKPRKGASEGACVQGEEQVPLFHNKSLRRQRYTLFHYAQRKTRKNLILRANLPPHPPEFDNETLILRHRQGRPLGIRRPFIALSTPLQVPFDGSSTDFRR